MRARDFITESKGLFGRKVGDVFADDNGNSVSFKSVQMFPSTTPGDGYPDDRAMLVAFSEATDGFDAESVNVRAPKARAFAIAKLNFDDGSEDVWVKWFVKVPTNLMGAWTNKETPPGWSLQIKTAIKARSGLTPQDLIKTDIDFPLDPATIIDKLRQMGASSAVLDGLQEIAEGVEYAGFVGMGDQLEAVRDHLAEIFVPIALATGQVGGDAEAARQEILKANWTDCKIRWPQNKNNNLVDSEIIAPNGAILGISNKGNRGAKASVKNIFDAIAKAPREMIDQHRSVVDLIDIINKQTAKEGPLLLGENLGIISKDLANEIRGLLKQVTQSTAGLSPEAHTLFSRYGSRPGSTGYSIGNVLLSNVAKSVASAINTDPQFSEACLIFLNQSSIVQIYTHMFNEGGIAAVDRYESKFPPNYSGKVVLDAGKNYTSTEIKGKFAFDIN